MGAHQLLRVVALGWVTTAACRLPAFTVEGKRCDDADRCPAPFVCVAEAGGRFCRRGPAPARCDPLAAPATAVEHGPEDVAGLQAALDGATPGTVIALRDGEYVLPAGGLRLS